LFPIKSIEYEQFPLQDFSEERRGKTVKKTGSSLICVGNRDTGQQVDGG